MNAIQNHNDPQRNPDNPAAPGTNGDPRNKTGGPSDEQVVNTEEQGRAVNTDDRDWAANPTSKEPALNASEVNPGETDTTDGGSETENPRRTEGGDAGSAERKNPNY